METNKYQFYLDLAQKIDNMHNEAGEITGEQWFSLMNRVLDCVYKELCNKNPVYSSGESSWCSSSSFPESSSS